MTVLSTPYLELSIRIWLAIPFSGGVNRPDSRVLEQEIPTFLRCSLLSKLDIWKRIVELVHTCSLWLLHILLLDFFHLNTRCRHTRVHLKFTFKNRYNQNFMVCSRKWCWILRSKLWHSVLIYVLQLNTSENFQKYNFKCEKYESFE